MAQEKEYITVNVGGTHYSAFKHTLCKASYFGSYFKVHGDNDVFVDRSGELFALVLHYLRTDSLKIESRLVGDYRKEFVFYGIEFPLVSMPDTITFVMGAYEDGFVNVIPSESPLRIKSEHRQWTPYLGSNIMFEKCDSREKAAITILSHYGYEVKLVCTVPGTVIVSGSRGYVTYQADK